MPDNTQNDGTNVAVSRRSILKTASVGGFSILAGTQIGSAGGSEKKRVPKVLDGDHVIEWMEVPSAWLDQHHHAKEAKREFTNEMFRKEGVLDSSLVRSPDRYGDKHGFQIEVTINPETFNDDIPERYNGVTVVQEEGSPKDSGPTCYNDQNFDIMPGGAWIEGDYGRGTSSWEVEYNGNYYIMTAAHLFGANCSNYNIGDPAYQYSRRLGSLEGYYTDYDFAICSHDYNGIAPSDDIKGESTTYDIKGVASEASIADRVVSPIDGYRKMGTSSGETTGGIGAKDYSINHCFDFNNEGVRGSADIVEGDSGGPAFSVEDGQAVVLFLCSWGEGGRNSTYNNCSNNYLFNKSAGTAAYRINNLGFRIVTNG